MNDDNVHNTLKRFEFTYNIQKSEWVTFYETLVMIFFFVCAATMLFVY